MYFRHNSNIVTSCVAIVVILATLTTGGEGLQIKELKVPDAIINGSQTAVVLDCDYAFDENESHDGLVVKWYFNQNPVAVYQWIITKSPQGLGVLKDKLNLDYHASKEVQYKHRALQIMNPTIELSGEYKCKVSTFNNETSQSKKMIIYVPGKSLEMKQTKQNGNSAVNISCMAEGVFPEPKLSIFEESGSKVANVHVVTIPRHGLYDIYASIVLDDADLKSPEDGNTFECVLEIPEANFTTRTSAVYFTDNNTSSRVTYTWLLLLWPLTLCLRL